MMTQTPVGLVWITPSENDYASMRISSDYHLGCGYLAAYLEAKGIRSKQYITKSISPDEFARLVISDGVKVLGFSVKDTNFYAVRWAANAIKSIDPSIVVAVGGLTATFSDELMLRECEAIDVCLRGYSEHSFHGFVEGVLAGRDWSKTPGISYLSEGSFLQNAEQKVPAAHDLDFLPSPYLSGVLPPEAGLKVGLSTSRGCVFRCTFCNPTAMAGYKIAYHSDERVLSEIKLIDAAVASSGFTGKRIMLLNEDIFALNVPRTIRICDRLAQDPPRHLYFACETRIEHLTEEALRSMYAAGFRLLKFGLESANPRVLNLIKKVRTTDGAKDDYAAEKEFLERIAGIVRLAKSIGFRMVAGAIFGLPGESLPDSIETLDYLRKIDIDEYYHNFLHLFPGTEAFRTHREWGYKVEVQPDFYPTIYRTSGWPYSVELVPRLTEKLDHSFRHNIVQL
jgi:radical SAM superfamily enzyme YgiQ (UPF0313 family)